MPMEKALSLLEGRRHKVGHDAATQPGLMPLCEALEVHQQRTHQKDVVREHTHELVWAGVSQGTRPKRSTESLGWVRL